MHQNENDVNKTGWFTAAFGPAMAGCDRNRYINYYVFRWTHAEVVKTGVGGARSAILTTAWDLANPVGGDGRNRPAIEGPVSGLPVRGVPPEPFPNHLSSRVPDCLLLLHRRNRGGKNLLSYTALVAPLILTLMSHRHRIRFDLREQEVDRSL